MYFLDMVDALSWFELMVVFTHIYQGYSPELDSAVPV